MAYDLSEINYRTVADPKGFIAGCDADYGGKISRAADMIAGNLRRSPIVLLSGPSGSGKTTTAQKIEEELFRRGIKSYTISLDNYFKTVDPATTPRTAEGGYDFESPGCLDMELLNEHFNALARGERIFVPKYEFSRQMRVVEPSKSLRLGRDEIAIFEGIHALNDEICSRQPGRLQALYLRAQQRRVQGPDGVQGHLDAPGAPHRARQALPRLRPGPAPSPCGPTSGAGKSSISRPSRTRPT